MDYEKGVATEKILTDQDIVAIVRNKVDETEKEENKVIVEEKKISFTALVEYIDNSIKFNEQKEGFTNEELNTFMLLTDKLKFCQLKENQSSLDAFIKA